MRVSFSYKTHWLLRFSEWGRRKVLSLRFWLISWLSGKMTVVINVHMVDGVIMLPPDPGLLLYRNYTITPYPQYKFLMPLTPAWEYLNESHNL